MRAFQSLRLPQRGVLADDQALVNVGIDSASSGIDRVTVPSKVIRQRMPRKTTPHDDRRMKEVLDGFRRIWRTLRVAARETQVRYEVSAAQLFVLDELQSASTPLSVTSLAERTMTDRSSVTVVVDRLVENGLVTRSRSKEDRRRTEVQLTRAGARLAKSAPLAPTMQLIEGLRRLSPGELEMLAISMNRLLHELGLSAQHAGFLFEEEADSGGGERNSRSRDRVRPGRLGGTRPSKR